ncbi:glutathione S-transferase N-terminal domain-containing protein [Rhizobium viscosum]|uniref:glutathione S-transferase N-terminal domain-containing protein n=1 Tax=Rhizobium viscosum TaxID=1673 RepID=UPI0035E41C71
MPPSGIPDSEAEHREPSYLAINPEGKVPVLLVDGRPLTEVAGILFYLARRFPCGTTAHRRSRSRGTCCVVDVVPSFSSASSPAGRIGVCPGRLSDRRKAAEKHRLRTADGIRNYRLIAHRNDVRYGRRNRLQGCASGKRVSAGRSNCAT